MVGDGIRPRGRQMWRGEAMGKPMGVQAGEGFRPESKSVEL